jgi:transcriptional regulator with XRE-family HTH domain
MLNSIQFPYMNKDHYYPEKLAEIRKAIGTQKEVADKVNVTNTTISRAENGKHASFELLSSITKLAGRDVQEVLK